MPKAKSEQSDQPVSFEKSLARLEQIVQEMEGGDLSLEKMIERFEEGTALIRTCSAKLSEVEKKIDLLVKKGDEVVAEPFEPGEGTGGAGA
jgi:exodeoxyribonuclease VII small subunit